MNSRSIKFQNKHYLFKQIGSNTWELMDDLIVNLSDFHSGSTIAITAGFRTDFRSGPNIFNIFVPKFGIWYVIHDWLYQNGISTKDNADREQDFWMRHEGVSWIKRQQINLAVRLFGKKYWDYYRNGGEFPFK